MKYVFCMVLGALFGVGLSYFLGGAWAELSVGFTLGLVGNLLVSIFLSARQFEHSVAGYRVQMVVQATRSIVQGIEENVRQSRNRDKYKFSLGVMIDDLAQAFGTNESTAFVESGGWPRVVQESHSKSGIGRWKRFVEHVRPVVDDINGYVFISNFPWLSRFFPRLRQLRALMALCSQLETVAGELDAAFEFPSLIEERGGRIYPLQDKDASTLDPLRNQYRELHKVWHEWLQIVR